jgi:predicted PurR-regulated permease PerM
VGWAVFMVIYGVAVISSVDNFAKPILMSRAGNLSMLLVVLGVFGGAIAFGFIGLFVGPALLAVGWSVMKAWLDNVPEVATK